MKGLGQAIGGRAFGDDVARDEPGDGAIGHVAQHGVHHAVLSGFAGAAARGVLVQQAHQHFRRQLSDRGRDIAQHRIEQLRLLLRDRRHEPSDHAHERRALRADAAFRPVFNRAHHLDDAIRIAREAEQFAHRGVVEVERRHAVEAVGDDVVPDGGVQAVALAQHLGVVDLA